MLEHWIKPVEPAELEAFFVPRNAFGHAVAFEPAATAGQATIALVGADRKWARRVRRQLYQLSSKNRLPIVCDLGDFRKLHPEFVVPALKEMLASNFYPVVIGARADFSLTLLHAMHQITAATQAVFIHESIPSWISAAPDTSGLHVLGVQQHLMHHYHQDQAEKQQVRYTRLGQIRNDVVSVEPVIRDAHLICADMSMLRSSDMPAQSSHSTSGLFTEEACQILRFAGMSPGVRALVLTGHDPMAVTHGPSANTVAQLLWYFIDGFHQRVQETPGFNEHFTRYMVHLKQYDFDLSFHKSEKSGRWWVEVPGKEGARLYSCGYRDYQSACEDVVTERILQCMEIHV